jgi:hypothetical protein
MNRGINTAVLALLAVVDHLPATAADAPQPPASVHSKVVAIADGDTLIV